MGSCCCWRITRDYESLSSNKGKKEPLLSRYFQKSVNEYNNIPFVDHFLIFGQDKLGSSFFSIFDPKQKCIRQLPIPRNAQFFNYSAVARKEFQKLIICGGIRHNLTGITSLCFEYDFETHTCTPLPDMLDFRYTFPILYHENKIYAIGGRVYGGDDTSILKRCEVFDYAKNSWHRISDLNVARCTSTAILYNNQIWVLGGYTGQYQRSRKIEKYNSEFDRWDLLEFKLLFGFENGNVISTGRPNELLIFGGKLNYGNSRNVWLYNLEKQTVLNRKPLCNDNILSKHFVSGNSLYLLGENPINNFFVENYKIDSMELSSHNLSLPPHHSLEKFKQYNFNPQQINLPYLVENEEIIPSFKDYNIIFGTDAEPFQLELNGRTGDIAVKAIPLSLKLRNFQACCRIDANRVLFAGGINISFQRISSKSYIYDLKQRTVTKLSDMRRMRYTFPLIYKDNYVYAIAGRDYGEDKNAIFSDCERYNLTMDTWERVPSLNIKRCTTNAFIYKERIYVAGGFLATGKRANSIEVLNEKKNRWELLGILLPLPLEAAVLIKSENEVIFLSGRGDKGDTNGKYVFRNEKGDLDEMCTLSDKMVKEGCLNKLVHVRDKFIVFGGNDFNNIMLINEDNFENYVEGPSHDPRESITAINHEDEETEQWSQWKEKLKAAVSKVAFNMHFLKRNSGIMGLDYSC